MANTRELWEQLDNESPRQFEGFKAFRSLLPKDRNLINAWRFYSGNASAPKVPPSFSRWYDELAWPERSRAYDLHLERIRMRGMMEDAIRKEAKNQAASSEQLRNRTYELLTLAYEKSVEYLENIDWNDLRFQDAVSIIKVHLEAAKALSNAQGESLRPEDDWNEDDDREVQRVLRDLQEEQAPKGSVEDNTRAEEEADETDEDRGGSEDTKSG